MSKKPVVYLVDNDPESLAELEVIFKQQNYAVRSYDDAERFMSFIEPSASPVRPALIVIDVHCEHLSSFEMTRRLQAKYKYNGKSVPIVIVSKYHSLIDDMEAQHAGALGLLVKPVNFENIVSVIEAARERRQRFLQTYRSS